MKYLKKKYSENTAAIKQVKINGYELLVCVNESVGRQIYGLKKYEQENTLFLKKIVQPSWVCFDVGAHVGYYTLLFSMLSKEGWVYAFEANKRNALILELNTVLNSCKNVTVAAVALDKIEGKRPLYVNSDSGLSSFQDTQRGFVAQVLEVVTTTLDHYMGLINIRRVDLIKMDIEGAEKLVLEGSVDVLTVLKPKIILVELCPQNLIPFKESVESVVGFLNQYEYVPYFLQNGKLKIFNHKSLIFNQDIYFLSCEGQKLYL